MLLKNLIKNIQSKVKTINIKNLSLDSRKVKKGDLFFALKGSKHNGNSFISHAISNGAKAIVCSKNTKIKLKKKIPLIKVKNVRKSLVFACSKFYRKKPNNIIAVTGTNGKSSVADFYCQILEKNKTPVASIGTLGIKRFGKIKKTNLTSLDVISFHEELANLKKLGINNVIVEASSHGLLQGRLDGVKFKLGIFTNFSQDHLDYHKNMKNYFNAKMILFKNLLPKGSPVILDKEDKKFPILKRIAIKKKLKILEINNKIKIDLNQNLFIGKFQIKNILMSVLAAQASGLKIQKIKPKVESLKNVNGRLELIKTLPNKAKVFVDFAHTPDALKTVLNALKIQFGRSISIVFGCGGERDIKKRKDMANIVKNFCDKIYVTDDNPRKEDPKKIRRMITKELKNKNFVEIGNRAKAIKLAILNSEPSEIILVAGKGHEITQDYGNKIFKISDKSIIKKTSTKKLKYKKNNFNEYFNSKILKKITNKNKIFKFEGVSINSKEAKRKNLFIAIKGKKNDGHNYLHEAIKKGSNYCVISRKACSKISKKFIKCKNTYNFLYKLARFKRQNLKTEIIAITGSSGKTTLKNLLGNILKIYGPTYYSPKSFNNHYGVPLSLSNLEHSHKYGVFEIGMSRSGEINNLSKMTRPKVGIITNVAEAHIENFKNIAGIAKAKSEIINNIEDGGTIILNRDDKFFNYMEYKAIKKNINLLSFGFSKKSDIRLIKIIKFKKNYFLKIKAVDKYLNIKTKEINNQNIYNILCCLAVLNIFNLETNVIKNFFTHTYFLAGRGKIHKVKRFKTNFKLIDESYNANPLSVKNALLNLSKIKNKNSKKYVLLGDMLELGNKSEFYHKNLSKIINNTDIDKVFVYGNKVLKTYKYISQKKQGNILQNKNDFDEVFSKLIKKNDYLMIKGSNATGLNKLSENIIKGLKNAI